MKLPKKYLTSNPNIMKREIKKHGDKKDDDPSAYKDWDADYKSGKAGKGKAVPTKKSKYTKKYKEMFGENESAGKDRIMDFETFTVENLDEASKMSKDSPVYKSLKKKAKKSGFPLSILREVWSRGYAAWKNGHVPGTTPQQWAMARVNSFIVGGRTTEMSDKALYKRAKKSKRVNESQEHQELTEEQIAWLNGKVKKDSTWTLNPQTGLVDINGSFSCAVYFPTPKNKALHGIRFGNVTGSFDCSSCYLLSLEGTPRTVGVDFECSNNPLDSLEGGPLEVGRDFKFYATKVTSLEGAPKIVGRDFICTSSKLVTLKGAPQTIMGKFECKGNELETLEGGPEIVNGTFDCDGNKLQSLKGGPRVVGTYYQCCSNDLLSLEGAPEKVGHFFCRGNKNLTSLEGASNMETDGYFNCSGNNLTSLKGSPKKVGWYFDCTNNPLETLEGVTMEIGGKFRCDSFATIDGQWNVGGWLNVLERKTESTRNNTEDPLQIINLEDSKKLILTILSDDVVDQYFKENPFEIGILDNLPEFKEKVLKRTGLRDLSILGKALSKGML